MRGAAQIERAAADGRAARGGAQRARARQRQSPRRNAGAAGVAVGARERDGARGGLGGRSRPAQHARHRAALQVEKARGVHRGARVQSAAGQVIGADIDRAVLHIAARLSQHALRLRRASKVKRAAAHRGIAGRGAQRALNHQRTGRNAGAAGVAVGRRQNGNAGADLRDIARTGDGAADRQDIAAVEHQMAVVDHIPADRARGAAIAQLQRAAADRGAAGIGVGAGKNGGAGALLHQIARATDRARQRHRVGAVDHQRAIVDDIANDRARGAAIAQLQRAAGDGGAAGVAVAGGEDGGASACLHHAARAADLPAKGHRVGAVEGQRAIVDHIANDRTRGAAIAQLQPGAAVDRGAAGIGVGAGEDLIARALHIGTRARNHARIKPAAIVGELGRAKRDIAPRGAATRQTIDGLAVAIERQLRGRAIAHHHRRIGREHIARPCRQRGIADRGGARIGVGARCGQRDGRAIAGAVGIDHAAGAGQAAAQRGGVAIGVDGVARIGLDVEIVRQIVRARHNLQRATLKIGVERAAQIARGHGAAGGVDRRGNRGGRRGRGRGGAVAHIGEDEGVVVVVPVTARIGGVVFKAHIQPRRAARIDFARRHIGGVDVAVAIGVLRRCRGPGRAGQIALRDVVQKGDDIARRGSAHVELGAHCGRVVVGCGRAGRHTIDVHGDIFGPAGGAAREIGVNLAAGRSGNGDRRGDRRADAGIGVAAGVGRITAAQRRCRHARARHRNTCPLQHQTSDATTHRGNPVITMTRHYDCPLHFQFDLQGPPSPLAHTLLPLLSPPEPAHAPPHGGPPLHLHQAQRSVERLYTSGTLKTK